MPKSSPPPVEPAFTLIELLVVIATITILIAIALPVFSGVLERAKATKDLSNLRQIGSATQMYMNDNNGVFPGSTAATWMSQLEQSQKYLSAWRVLESPFDKRAASELVNAQMAISYGINLSVYSGGVGISADKITKPVTFIVFAPAQDNSSRVNFLGTPFNPGNQGVTLSGNNNTVTSNPGLVPRGGPQNNRTKINALCADWHVETMPWSGTGPAFTNTNPSGNDPDAPYRWSP